jgi:3-oxo-5alpha-steroid 4-dehydrogenase
MRSRRGLILCAGGFVFNREMVAEHLPEFVPGLPLGTAGDDGLGIRLGQSVGGKLEQMHRASAWRFLYPPNAFAQGVLVNDKGERFANEFWYGAKIGEAMVEENHGVATLIIDGKLKKLAHEQSKPGELQWFQRAAALMNLYLNCKKAEDLDALAKMLEVPRETLQKTLDENNAVAQGIRRDRFEKAPDSVHPLSTGPYYAIDCSLGSKRHLCAVMTLGGLAVDEKTGQVLSENGGVVPGLYAAGRNAVGICSRQYVSGLSIADCVYSGRRAGKSASKQ